MNRKALKREYKLTRRPMGIFRVRNTVNAKSFIGASTDLPAILNRHQAQLKMRGHPNSALQKDWNELGPEAFVFEVLDTLTPPDDPQYNPTDDLRILEELWMDRLSPYDDHGYNVKRKGIA